MQPSINPISRSVLNRVIPLMILTAGLTTGAATHAAWDDEKPSRPHAGIASTRETVDRVAAKNNITKLIASVQSDWKDGRMSIADYDDYWSHITALRKEIANHNNDKKAVAKALQEHHNALMRIRSNGRNASFCDYLIYRLKADIARNEGKSEEELAARKKAVEYAEAFYNDRLNRFNAGLTTSPETADALADLVDARIALAHVQAANGKPVSYSDIQEWRQYLASLDKAITWMENRGGLQLSFLRCERLNTMAKIAHKQDQKDKYKKLQKQIIEMNLPELASMQVRINLKSVVNANLIHANAELALADAKGEPTVTALERAEHKWSNLVKEYENKLIRKMAIALDVQLLRCIRDKTRLQASASR